MLDQRTDRNIDADETRFYIFRYLKQHSDRAFTVSDLVDIFYSSVDDKDATTPGQGKSPEHSVKAMVEDMVRASFIVKKVVDGEDYFSFNETKKNCDLSRLAPRVWVLR